MRYLKIFLAVLAAALILAVPAYAEDGERKPLYAADITDGTYDIEVESSASMFRVVDCSLTVSGDTLTAVMTLSGKGYGKLYMGTGNEALNANESEYIPFAEDSGGKYTYTVPIPALDTPVQCAAWSTKRERWYDRDLVFRSDSLPEGAVKKGADTAVIIIVAAVVCAAVICTAVIIIAKRKKKNDE